jgi:hypothetical protein
LSRMRGVGSPMIADSSSGWVISIQADWSFIWLRRAGDRICDRPEYQPGGAGEMSQTPLGFHHFRQTQPLDRQEEPKWSAA